MSMLNDNLDANFQLFIEQVRESGQVWGLRYGGRLGRLPLRRI